MLLPQHVNSSYSGGWYVQYIQWNMAQKWGTLYDWTL